MYQPPINTTSSSREISLVQKAEERSKESPIPQLVERGRHASSVAFNYYSLWQGSSLFSFCADGTPCASLDLLELLTGAPDFSLWKAPLIKLDVAREGEGVTQRKEVVDEVIIDSSEDRCEVIIEERLAIPHPVAPVALQHVENVQEELLDEPEELYEATQEKETSPEESEQHYVDQIGVFLEKKDYKTISDLFKIWISDIKIKTASSKQLWPTQMMVLNFLMANKQIKRASAFMDELLPKNGARRKKGMEVVIRCLITSELHLLAGHWILWAKERGILSPEDTLALYEEAIRRMQTIDAAQSAKLWAVAVKRWPEASRHLFDLGVRLIASFPRTIHGTVSGYIEHQNILLGLTDRFGIEAVKEVVDKLSLEVYPSLFAKISAAIGAGKISREEGMPLWKSIIDRCLAADGLEICVLFLREISDSDSAHYLKSDSSWCSRVVYQLLSSKAPRDSSTVRCLLSLYPDPKEGKEGEWIEAMGILFAVSAAPEEIWQHFSARVDGLLEYSYSKALTTLLRSPSRCVASELWGKIRKNLLDHNNLSYSEYITCLSSLMLCVPDDAEDYQLLIFAGVWVECVTELGTCDASLLECGVRILTALENSCHQASPAEARVIISCVIETAVVGSAWGLRPPMPWFITKALSLSLDLDEIMIIKAKWLSKPTLQEKRVFLHALSRLSAVDLLEELLHSSTKDYEFSLWLEAPRLATIYLSVLADDIADHSLALSSKLIEKLNGTSAISLPDLVLAAVRGVSDAVSIKAVVEMVFDICESLVIAGINPNLDSHWKVVKSIYQKQAIGMLNVMGQVPAEDVLGIYDRLARTFLFLFPSEIARVLLEPSCSVGALRNRAAELLLIHTQAWFAKGVRTYKEKGEWLEKLWPTIYPAFSVIVAFPRTQWQPQPLQLYDKLRQQVLDVLKDPNLDSALRRELSGVLLCFEGISREEILKKSRKSPDSFQNRVSFSAATLGRKTDWIINASFSPSLEMAILQSALHFYHEPGDRLDWEWSAEGAWNLERSYIGLVQYFAKAFRQICRENHVLETSATGSLAIRAISSCITRLIKEANGRHPPACQETALRVGITSLRILIEIVLKDPNMDLTPVDQSTDIVWHAGHNLAYIAFTTITKGLSHFLSDSDEIRRSVTRYYLVVLKDVVFSMIKLLSRKIIAEAILMQQHPDHEYDDLEPFVVRLSEIITICTDKMIACGTKDEWPIWKIHLGLFYSTLVTMRTTIASRMPDYNLDGLIMDIEKKIRWFSIS